MGRIADALNRVRNRKGGEEDPLDEIDPTRCVQFDVGGEIVSIPVDEEGFVPRWALAQRFQEVGQFEGDVGVPSARTLHGRLTPEQVIEWWLDPSSCDIEGIDGVSPGVYDVSGLPPEQRMVQSRIAVDADPREQRRIRSILADAFTVEELAKMSREGSFVITVMDDCGEATGCYWRRQDGFEVPLIALERHCTPDGVVHEVVHHLRVSDTAREGELRTTFPTGEDGKLDARTFNSLPQKVQNRIVDSEERHTVAETVVRTGRDPRQSGYYDGVKGKNPRAAYLEDRRILTDAPPDMPDSEIPKLKGKAARDAVSRSYEYSNIAMSAITSMNVRKR